MGRHGVPTPAEPPREDEMPRTLTFALSEAERAAVLAVLRRYGRDRAAALKAALGLGEHGAPPERRDARRGG